VTLDRLQTAARQLGALSPELAQEFYDRAVRQGLEQVGACGVRVCVCALVSSLCGAQGGAGSTTASSTLTAHALPILAHVPGAPCTHHRAPCLGVWAETTSTASWRER
jgi:hypothetical protein